MDSHVCARVQEKLAIAYESLASKLFDEMVIRTGAESPPSWLQLTCHCLAVSLDETALNQALDYIIPWVQRIRLYLLPEYEVGALTCVPLFWSHSSTCQRTHTLYNMCLLTHRYQTDRPVQVQRLWITLAGDQSNVDPVVEFLLRVGVRKRNPSFIPLAKKVC